MKCLYGQTNRPCQHVPIYVEQTWPHARKLCNSTTIMSVMISLYGHQMQQRPFSSHPICYVYEDSALAAALAAPPASSHYLQTNLQIRTIGEVSRMTVRKDGMTEVTLKRRCQLRLSSVTCHIIHITSC